MVSSYWENIFQAPGFVRKIQIKNTPGFFLLNASEPWFRKAVKYMSKSVFTGTDSRLLIS